MVTEELKKLGLHPVSVELGEAVVEEKSLSDEQYQQLFQALNKIGFEILDDRRSRMIEQIKNLLIDLIHHQDEQPNKKYSDLIAAHLHYEYSYLSGLFSEVEGITIEQFIIHQKIEKAKELLVYDELTLSEIAYKLHYSSVAHLSAQFKKTTGLTPSQFKLIGSHKRKPLDEAGRSGIKT
jgi:AraC-like DNA-binding protein